MRWEKSASLVGILFSVFLAAANFGCGGSSAGSQGPPPPPPLSVSVSPTTATVQEGTTQQFTATVNNDAASKGVTWSVSCAASSPFCGNTGPGTLSAMSSPSGVPVTYTAPNTGDFNYPDELDVVTATSVSNPSISATATVKTPPPPLSVSVLPAMGITHVNGGIAIEADEQNSAVAGVTWNIQGCSGGASVCGTLSSPGCPDYECFIGYLPPAAVPPGGQVTVVATSIQDPTVSAGATIQVSPIDFAVTSYAAGNAPEDVVVADFNGDGKLDLAVADNGNPSTGDNGGVSILLGNGDGTFQTAQLVNAGMNPTFIAFGDFNGDGKMDLAVSDLGQLPSGGNGNLSILLGNGDGTFQSPITVSAGLGPYAQALGDFNGDGKLDIAVIDFGNLNGNDGAVYILLGNGDGTFKPAVLVNAGDNPAAFPTAIVAGDFNGDGKLDLAVTTDDANLSVLLGNGDGTFQAPVFYFTGQIPTSLTAGDLRNSGNTDLALTALGGCTDYCASTIKVLFGNGDGTFQSAQNVSLNYANGPPPFRNELSCEWQGLQFLNGIRICFPVALQIADFDGSGKLDLVGIGGVPDGDLFVLPGNGDGTYEGILGYTDYMFEGPWPVAGGGSVGIAVADFNGDGKPDIVSTWQGDPNYPPNVTVLLNQTVPYGAQTRTKRKSNVTGRK